MIVDFARALYEIKDGGRVAREGWNGKGMSVELVAGARTRDGREIAPFQALTAADGSLVPWVASQVDILAEDWQVV